MNRTIRILLLLLLCLQASASFVFADAAVGPVIVVGLGIILGMIAVGIIAIVLLIKAIRRKKNNRKEFDQ